MTLQAPPPVVGPAPRPGLLIQGLSSAALCAALGGLAQLGAWPLAAGVLVVQLVLLLGFLALVDAPADGGAFLVGVAAAVVADLVVLRSDGRLSGLAGVVALVLVAALAHQLLRKERSRVTESLSDTLVGVVLALSVCCLLALRLTGGGRQATLTCLAAGGAALLAGRLGDAVMRRPALAVGASRGWPGLLLGLGAGAAAAVAMAAVAGHDSPVSTARGALLGLAVAAAAAAADLGVDLGASELTDRRRDARRVSALRPAALVLPLAAFAPVAFVAGRLVLS